jgi:hypothetical protein
MQPVIVTTVFNFVTKDASLLPIRNGPALVGLSIVDIYVQLVAIDYFTKCGKVTLTRA